jgi:hypothetical protein
MVNPGLTIIVGFGFFYAMKKGMEVFKDGIKKDKINSLV